MTTGKRQHTVPQMMIRRFAGDEGTLVELFKPTLAIGKRKRPAAILFRDDFYRDRTGDLDANLFSQIEQKFARYYDRIANGPVNAIENDSKAGIALIEWIASMLCRTPSYIAAATAAVLKRPRNRIELDQFLAMSLAPDLMRNVIRIDQFKEYRAWLTRLGWKWKLRILPAEWDFVITDHPVCMTHGEPIVVVPLSKKRALFGGLPDEVERHGVASPREINAFLAGWADRSIFAASRPTLEMLIEDLQGTGKVGPPEWCKAARKSQFGLVERITNTPLPDRSEVNRVYEHIQSRYGPSRISDRRAK